MCILGIILSQNATQYNSLYERLEEVVYVNCAISTHFMGTFTCLTGKIPDGSITAIFDVLFIQFHLPLGHIGQAVVQQIHKNNNDSFGFCFCVGLTLCILKSLF